MAEDQIIYDQVDQGGDPDPLGLRKRLGTGAGKDPLGLRSKLTATQQPTPKAFEIKISQPTFKSAPAKTGERVFTDEAPVDELAPIKLQGKARVAHEAIQKELLGNRDVKADMIKQRRFEEAARNKQLPSSDMSKTQSDIAIERLIPKDVKPQDIPVTEEDLINEDNDIIADRGKAVRLMEETIKKYPQKAKEIQKNLYTLDAFNSLGGEDHKRVPKIEENAKQIEKGNLLYDARNNRLIKPLGLIGGAIEGWKQKSQLFADYDFLKNTENDAAIAMDLEDRRTSHDMDAPIPVPRGKLAEVSQMIGGTPIKPIAGGLIASLAGPEASMAAGAAIGGREFAKLEYASNFQKVYNELRDQGIEKFEAVRQARSQAEQSAEVGAISGAAMGLVGAKMGAKPLTTAPFSNSFKQAAFDVLKKTGSDLGKAGLEGLAVGGVGALGEVYKNKLAQSAGINRKLDEGVAEQLEGGLLSTVAMAAAIKAGRGITKPAYKSLLHGLSKMPDEQINGMLQEQVQAGQITEKAAQETTQRINEYRGLDKLIPDNITEEARFKIQDKIQKRQQYEQQLESVDKAYHPEIKEKIKALDEEIVGLTRENKQKVEKPESGLSREQEKEATELAEEWLHEGILPDVYEGMIKQDPVGFWKMLAQQAQNRDANWRPLTEELPEQAVRDQFGDTAVEYAKELFPAPESKAEVTFENAKEGDIITLNGEQYEVAGRSTSRKGAEVLELKEIKKATDAELEDKALEIVAARHSNEYRTGITKDDIIKYHYGEYRNELASLKANRKASTSTIQVGKEQFAKEVSPAPDVAEKEPLVSVIQPGEIGRPETITIKPDESAIPQQITDEVDVRESSNNGEAMGEGNAQPEIPSGEEVGAIQEGNVAPTEEVAPPEPPRQSAGIYVERPETQLSFHGLQDTANEFGYADVRKRERVSHLQERKNAEITVNEWASKGEYQKNINDLLNRIAQKEMVPTAKQRLILEQYLANEKQKARNLPKTSKEYDTQVKKVEQIKIIGEIARQEAGAALNLPNGGSRPHPILDETDAMVAKMEANAVDVLTDQQKAEVEAQVEKYKKATDEANEKVAKLEEQVAQIEAEKEFRKVKSATSRTKKTAEERAAYRRSEIEAAREALKKLRTGESGLSAVPLPGIQELIAIAPHVKNIMVDLVAQGVDNLQEVVKKIHGEFKDVLEGITEKDIHNIIAGEYNEKRPPLTELQKQIRDIQDEAKLINKLEAILNGMPPKAEKAKRERNQKIKDLQDKIKELRKGEPVDPDVAKLRSIKTRNEKRIQELKDKIARGDFEKEKKVSIFDREDVKSKYPKLRNEALDAIARKEDAQHEFDLALFKDEMSRRSKLQKAADFGAKLVHTSKAVLAGIDDSATFVQNGMAMLANPKTGAKVWLEHWKDAFSESRFKRELAAIHARPDWEIIKNSGLEILEPTSEAAGKVEEAFEQNLLAGKVKIGGKEFHPWKNTGGIFERAFTSMGNNFRLALFEKRMKMLVDEGKTFESDPKEYKDAARAINELTGRGKPNQYIQMASPVITPFIWAPRLLASTINTLGLSDLVLSPWGKGYYQNLTPTQRNYALGQMGRGIAVGVGIMGAAAFGGADVDWDPRSVTFGDIKVGNHHYNVFGRYTPVVKTVVQATLGSRMIKGQKQDLDNPKMGGKTRTGVIGGFFRGKMTPFAGSMYDLANHKNYFTNEPFGVEDLPKALLVPMSIKELKEGWEKDGTATLLTRFLPAFEGIKTSDERDFVKSGGSSGGNKKPAKPTKPGKPSKANN